MKDVLTVIVGIVIIAGIALLWVLTRQYEDGLYSEHIITKRRHKELEERTDELEAMYEELQQAIYDQQMDGLYTRAAFDELLHKAEDYRGRSR